MTVENGPIRRIPAVSRVPIDIADQFAEGRRFRRCDSLQLETIGRFEIESAARKR